MREILIIGIGAGDPDHLTVQAIEALRRVDVFFLLDKGAVKQDLAALRQEILRRHTTGAYRAVEIADPERDRTAADYQAAVEDWRRRRADRFAQLIRDELPDGGCGAFLVWGDPALYDSTLAILDDLRERDVVEFDHQVIPGISSVAVLTARHRIALNRIGRPVQITTGRRLADEGFPTGVDDLVVMLDAQCAFTQFTAADGIDIYWGAYLGTPDEILIAGPVHETADRIVTARAEARRHKGWIMDTYLLRRTLVQTTGQHQKTGHQTRDDRADDD
ncbi:precorrin-6A synthase (deacetylating) [Solwaraspora sp. WMMD792]|uniref:precorrin-6A synthase (deacetylating) n=1 Tax=Solwaraspora sp. WMMD792 TaxID=3016099 RepID=UPI0024175B89|nr:precorrin-6A synthase (deacetylating) [Solwaraspora sp. WMMD792]MDG4775089.1 precorrin-6A synthase (deacetylating) [Solwaraspora sp. WMMD792]